MLMLKAAALYIVIIISLMMAIISASLLSVAFYYRLEHQKKTRIDRLNSNIESGTTILLSAGYDLPGTDLRKDLYGDQKDSVILNQVNWGVFKSNTVRSFEQMDTLKRAFLSGTAYKDSAAIYLADEDRPLSVSGSTQITGDGELPKSGLKQSYVDGKAYEGKQLIKGRIKVSTRDLPALQEKWMAELLQPFSQAEGMNFNPKDSVVNSFFNVVHIYKLKTGQDQLSALKIKGKVVLISDSVLTLDQDLVLEDVLVYAPGIVVKDGFKGSCQLFARDSIIIGRKCEFLYPSFAGVFKQDKDKIQSKISIGQDSRFSGILMSYEKKRSDLQTIISLGKGVKVAGEVFAAGFIELEAPVTVYGKVYAKRFMMRKSGTLYENYLIDVVLNRKLLSKYYLSTPLFQRTNQDQQVLRWLD